MNVLSMTIRDFLLSLFAVNRGSRGGSYRNSASRWIQRYGNAMRQLPEVCGNCGNPELDSLSHCDECGWDPDDQR
jgi:hypothetical protein